MSTENIETFYPLSPMQQGMLFHSLLAAESGVYIEQLSCRLTGDLDVAAFRRAWQRAVERHSVLRTAFVGEALKEPVQIVHRRVEVPIEEQDWRSLTKEEQEARYESLLKAEQRRGFVLSEPPLMRLGLIRVADNSYIFSWTYHHLLLDGWSVPMLLQEVFACYEAFRQGRDLRLPPVRPYRDYIVWLRRQDAAKAEEFWRRTLKGFTTPTPLVVERRVASDKEPEYDEESLLVPRAESAAIQALARRLHVTLSTVVQSAWALVLSRYSGEEDVVFGVTVSGRPPDLPGVESMIGLFINTLPVRIKTPPDVAVGTWLKDVQAALVELRQYEYSPLVQVQGWSEVPRGTPLFNSILVFENYPIADTLQQREGSLEISDIRSAEQTNYPITVVSGPGDEILLKIHYECQRFDRDTIRRMLGHMATVLRGMAADPDQKLRHVPLLTDAERRQILIEWNNTAADFPRDRCVHQLFEEQAERTPQAIAVTFEDRSLTYRELNERANQLANYLRRQGIGPDSLVAVCTERSIELIVGVLAVLKAGGAYVPMDPTYPPERLAFMLDDTETPLVLTQQRLRQSLPQDVVCLCLDSDWPTLAGESNKNLSPNVTVGNLAYVIYTSGSTGRPKGVELHHEGLLNLVFWHRRAFAVSARDRATQLAGPGFDASVWEVWPYLTAGASIHIPDDNTRASPELLRDWLVAQGITITFLPTPLAESMMALPWPPDTSLRLVLTGGDRLHTYPPPGLPFQLINNYGPTEDTVVTTSGPVLPREHADAPPSIGRPIANTQVYILDAHMRPVPVGIPGELHIGGVGLARGYLKRPELTAEKFIDVELPIADRGSSVGGSQSALVSAKSKIYKTGDLACYLPNGEIEFLGRIDFQVKIRGFRVELGEIEAVLGEHPSVREAVVMAREDVPGDVRLVAYVIPRQGGAPDAGELRSFLSQKLPGYMVPSAFMFLDAFPLTPNGKVDRRALPVPDQGRFGIEVSFVAPRSPIEEVLASLWAQVLGVERVGIYDNFFELGGHSLLATQLVSRVRSAFHIELPLRTLFERPTVAEMAESIEAARREAGGLSAPPILPVPRDQELPLSYAQQRLWFLDQLEPHSPLYNITNAVRLSGHLDISALEHSLNEIVRRHEVLRTAFRTVEGRAMAVIASELRIPLPVIDLRHLPPDEREIEARRQANAEAQRPFDLAECPLLRMTLLRLDEQEHIAILTMHHIICDGWSMEVFINELATLYGAFTAGQPSPLPELTIQYADYAHWQRQWLQGEVLDRQINYWKQKLAGSPPLLMLPTDRPRPAVQTWRGATYSASLPADLSEKLRALSRKEGATLFMTLLAAFQTLLYRYTGQEDICVGTPIANRTRSEIEGLIGFFVNTLVMRTDLSGNPGFRDLLKRVRETALEAYMYQDVPFEMLVDVLQPERDMSHSPLFQVMFVLQNAALQHHHLPGLTLSSVEAESGIAKFDLTLAMADNPDGLGMSWEYNTDLFFPETIQRMSAHFQMLLEGIVTEPDRPIGLLPLLTEQERRQILIEWNDTAVDYDIERCAYELFEEQVKRTPDAVALEFAGQTMTYRELNERANQLAHYLHKQGVGPDDIVALCVERSFEMIVAIWGIIKAGAAYVPLAPDYPRERIAFILQDTRARILLTQERLLANLSAANVKITCLDSDWPIIEQESAENPAGWAAPDNLAYVIYTSGSTGTPKGVLVTHRNLVHLINARLHHYPQPIGRFLLTAPIIFDASVLGIIPTLCQGNTVVLPEPGLEQDVPRLAALIADRRIESVNMLASLYSLLLTYADPRQLDSLRLVVVGGEPLSGELVRKHYQMIPHASFYNEYGPTEGTVWCTVYKTRPDDAGGQIPIGKPIANTQIYILNSQMQPVPIGVPGELHLAGYGVAKGYLNRPDLTAEKFIDLEVPIGDRKSSVKPKSRIYKTGDLARYLPDGNIEFLGRIDQQVKVRGFRIELGEIEAVLSQCPGLREAVVLARGDAVGDEAMAPTKQLVAYVVPAEQPGPPPGAIRAFLREKLPEYMVPSRFVVMDALPLLPNGKVNRRALPAPDRTEGASERVYVPPRTPQEQALAAIWSQVLGIERVGIHDNFFELGGDSILTIQVVARANRAGIKISPKQMFQYPTVEQLARVAGRTQEIHAEQGIVTGEVPLTPIQHWYFEHHTLEPHHWNSSMLLELWQHLDVGLLEQTIGILLTHHDALRLRFRQTAAGWQQFIVGVDDPVPFSYVDISTLPPDEQKAAIEAEAARTQRSFNLEHGPLLRVVYFYLGREQAPRLLLVFHHLVTDGVSWRILIEDLQSVYHQLSHGQPVQLPPKTTSFRYWAQRLADYAQSPALREELGYWSEVASREFVPLPVDYQGGANTYGSTAFVTLSLAEDDTRILLQDVPSVFGSQVNDVLLAALVRTFNGWTGRRSLLVGMEGHGREDLFAEVDVSRTVGWFTSSFPVLLDLGETREVAEAVSAIGEQLRRIPRHGIGYGLLRYLCADAAVKQRLSAIPDPEVNFNYLGQFDQLPAADWFPFQMAPESVGPEQSPDSLRTDLLDIVAIVNGGQLHTRWIYSTNVHHASTIEKLAQNYVEELKRIVADCREYPVSSAVTR